MFTTGRIIFAISFTIVFIGFMIYSYRKDAVNHKIYYKNAALYVALALLITIALLIASKYVFKH